MTISAQCYAFSTRIEYMRLYCRKKRQAALRREAATHGPHHDHDASAKRGEIIRSMSISQVHVKAKIQIIMISFVSPSSSLDQMLMLMLKLSSFTGLLNNYSKFQRFESLMMYACHSI